MASATPAVAPAAAGRRPAVQPVAAAPPAPAPLPVQAPVAGWGTLPSPLGAGASPRSDAPPPVILKRRSPAAPGDAVPAAVVPATPVVAPAPAPALPLSPIARRRAALAGLAPAAIGGTAPPPAAAPAPPNGSPTTPAHGDAVTPIRGPHAALVEAMERSREIPTATSIRTVPVGLLDTRRKQLNAGLGREGSGAKVSFTHLIGYAIARAAAAMPDMLVHFTRDPQGRPLRVASGVHLGLAVDTRRKDGSRFLVVPVLRDADLRDFAGFRVEYERLEQDLN